MAISQSEVLGVPRAIQLCRFFVWFGREVLQLLGHLGSPFLPYSLNFGAKIFGSEITSAVFLSCSSLHPHQPG